MAKQKKGYYGNIVVITMALLMLPMSLIMNTASIFYTPCTQDLGVSLAAFGANLTIIMLGSAFGAPFVTTPLTRKVKLRWLIAAAMAVETLCFCIRAMTNSIYVFYATSLLISFPMGLLCNVSIPIVANAWFPKKPGVAIGIMASSQGLGGMLFSAIGGVLIQNIGWRNTFFVWAGICALFIPVAALLIRNDPSEVGQVAPGAETQSGMRTTAVAQPGMSRNRAIKTSAFWLLALTLILTSFSSNVNSYINPYSQQIGMSAAMAGFVSAMIQLGVFVNKILLGHICDRKGARVGGLFYVASGLACFLLILFSGGQTALIMLGCFLIGPLYAAVNLYGPIMTRTLFGTKDQPRIWALYVLLFCTFGGSAATIWGAVIGAIGYSGAFWLVLGLLLVIAVLILVLTGMREKIVAQWDTPEVAEKN